MRRSTANTLILIAALIWGTTFVAQQVGMKDVGPLTYTGIRFLIGALFIAPLALREYLRLSVLGISLGRSDLFAWTGLGVLLFIGAATQQIGIPNTTVTNAGFLTALYVPLVPLLAWIIHGQRPHIAVWPGAACSMLGTYLLSGRSLDSFTAGDFWVLGSTVFWASHVLWVGRVAAGKNTPILIAFWQFLVCGVLSMAMALPSEPISASGLVAGLPSILYGGLLSVGVGFTLQVVAQRHTRAADAAILMSSETLFAAIAGALYLGERLGPLQILGCAIMLASVLAVQLAPLWFNRAAVATGD